MKIFLSYASEQTALAQEITLALQAEHHTVFFDRASLPPGEPYNATIRQAIAKSRLFIFLISPHAVTAGRYTLTELEFAEHKWPQPWGQVLPVVALATSTAALPPYLRAGTILQPRGNIAAEVAAEVRRRVRPSRLRLLFVLLLLVMGSAGAAWWYQQVQLTRATVVQWCREAKSHQEHGRYKEAWKLVEQARTLAPHNAEGLATEVQLALAWLENAQIVNGQGSFAGIVATVRPALSRCATSPEKMQAADCLAHLGWGEFLQSRSGQGADKPEHFYQQALALDPENAYAHVLWGFHLVVSQGSLEEAKEHFARALASGRVRPYVREMQLAAWLYRNDTRDEDEVIRVVNDMRLAGDPLPPGDPLVYTVRWSRLWNIYRTRLLDGRGQQAFFATLSPSDHLATFQWIFHAEIVPEDKQTFYGFFLGSLQEHAGDSSRALTTLQTMQKTWGKELSYNGRLLAKTVEAITRLSR